MTPEALIEGIRLGDQHCGGIRCMPVLRLEPAELLRIEGELEVLLERERPSVVNDPRHATRWAGPFGTVLQYSLWNRSGRTDDFSADHDLSPHGKRFFSASVYPNLCRLVTALPDLVNFRANVLGPDSGLAPHEEHSIIRWPDGQIGARLRFHLPLATNPKAVITLDGAQYHLAKGTVYLVNHGCVHSVENRGPERRVHVSWDLLFTRESYAALFGAGPGPPMLEGLDPSERCLEPVRIGPVPPYRRLPRLVTQAEAERAALLSLR